MRGNCKSNRGKFVVMAVIGVTVGSAVVMLLWNWLTPALFGWKEIGFLQALGILILSKILFGGFGRCGRGQCGSHNMPNLESMTPEERERFEAKVKSKWCCKKSE
jgi:hypothetical protein